MAMLLDAGVGAAMGELLGALREMQDRARRFRPTLEQMESTLNLLEPLVVRICELNRSLGRPDNELESLITDMNRGKDLLRKYSEVEWWKCCCKANYQEELENLNQSMVTFAKLNLTLMGHENIMQVVLRNPGLRIVCLPPQPPSFIVGFDNHLNELKLKLLEDQVSLSVLTVTGTGGSGKTALAKMVCWDAQVKGKFKENIFFITFAKMPTLNAIVRQIYRHNGRQEPEFRSEEDAKRELEHLLRQVANSPILLVLDDVWPGSESLVDQFLFQIPNYKILVTSRFTIRRFGDPFVLLRPLDEADAINLFHNSASLNQSNSNIPDDVVRKIVRGCRGSPLALIVTGRSLSHQHLVVWDVRAKELSAGHSILEYSTDVLACLQKSLDVLDPMAIECFYDLCLFPEDQMIPTSALVDMWAERHNEDDARAMVKICKLINLNMADIVVTRNVARDTFDFNYHYVTQYDLLRELAIRHTSQEQEDQRNRLIIDISENNLPSWWNLEKEYQIAARLLSISTDEAFTSEWCNLQPPDVEVLVLNLRQKKKYTLPTFIEKMNKLKVLIITNYDLQFADLEKFELLHHLSALKRLRLESVSIPLLSTTGVLLNNLQKFSLFMCNVNETFQNCSMPNLVEMNIDSCEMVALPVVLSNIVSLKKLNIINCHELSALPEDIGQLVNLESLGLGSCAGLLELPDSITGLCSLKFLDISYCLNLTKLPENMGKLGNLGKLNVEGCSKLRESQLPSSIAELGSLRDVVCDQEMVALWEPYTTMFSGLRLEVV